MAEPTRELPHLIHGIFLGYHIQDQADLLRLFSTDLTGAVHQFLGTLQANQAWQDIEPAPIGHRTDTAKGLHEHTLGCGKNKIRRQRQVATGTGCRAIDQTDHRQLNIGNVINQSMIGAQAFAGHQRRTFIAAHALDIATGTKCATSACQDQRLDLFAGLILHHL